MIRKLLATTAIATLLSTGAYAQSTPAPADDSAQPAEEMQPADGSAAAPADDSAAQDDGAAAPADATAQDTEAEPVEDTAQDTEAKPAADTAQDTEMEPAEDTAQSDATAGSDTDMASSDMPEVEGHLASNLIGSSVYNSAADDAENIGEVNDVVIGKDGKAKFVVIGVGGFLGIGEKDVAIEYATLQWAERDGDMWLVVETTAEQLEQQQAFDRTAYDPEAMAAEEMAAEQQNMAPAGTAGTTMPQNGAVATAPATTGEAMESQDTASAEQPAADAEPEGEDVAAADSAEAPADGETVVVTEAPVEDAETTDQTAEAPAEEESTEQTAAAPAEDPAATDQTQTGAIDRSTLQEADMEVIRAEQFVGTTVYGADEETIGEIGDVILTEDGEVDAVLVDVGGFLGMGEKEVAIGMDNLQFMQDGDDNLYLYTQFTQEQLEAQPAYDEAAYAENRDTMRLTVEN